MKLFLGVDRSNGRSVSQSVNRWLNSGDLSEGARIGVRAAAAAGEWRKWKKRLACFARRAGRRHQRASNVRQGQRAEQSRCPVERKPGGRAIKAAVQQHAVAVPSCAPCCLHFAPRFGCKRLADRHGPDFTLPLWRVALDRSHSSKPAVPEGGGTTGWPASE